MSARFARGHDAGLKPVENWDFAVLAGTGALRSTVNDLLEFAAANLGYAETSLGAAMAAMLKIQRTVGPPGREIALGCQLSTIGGNEIVWHNGGTGGYRSFLGLDRKTRRGVVVLSNVRTAIGVDDIGQQLLDANVPLVKSAASGAKDFAKDNPISLIRGLARRSGR
jgi:serine-type D-Ala-D-Ala carboxypeptidase/endopeptidase